MSRQTTRFGLPLALAAAFAAPESVGQDRSRAATPVSETTLRIHDSAFRVVSYATGPVQARRPGQAGRRVSPTLPMRPDAAPYVFLNVHDDENTSVSAALVALSRVQARVVELRHTGARNLSIVRAGETFMMDPNRMFTDAGAEASLKRLSGRSDEALVRAVRAFADTLLERAGVPHARAVIALHNNTENAYTVRSYLPGAEYASDAAAVHVEPAADPDNFFFVTDRALYDALAAARYNVVLQHNAAATDDGSLSVWAGRRGIRYVNVEAQHGQVGEQRRMIATLVRLLHRLDAAR